MRPDSDADLREMFRELREHDRVDAPAFAITLARAPVRVGRRSRLAWGAGGLVLATLVGLSLWLRTPAPAPEMDSLARLAWRSPTDFLLAGASDTLQGLAWSPSPTSSLGQPSFTRLPENR